MSLDQLETEITELAAHINAATCRWLLLVGELDRRRGWLEWGCKTCAHWLSLRCGIGLVAARQQVRVARALAELPGIAAAFGRGELSYSQVRALTRVATTQLEEPLLGLARHATGGQLEVLVRSYRGVLARELGPTNDAYRDRYLLYSHEDDGSLVISARIPAEEGVLVLKALEAAGDQVREAIKNEADLESDSAESSSGPTVTRADALVRMAETALAADSKPVSGSDRHEVVVHVDAEALAHDSDGACHVETGPALHPETARRLACDSSVVRILERDGRPLSVGRRTRTVPPALARALRSRDGGCRFPGCSEHRFVDAHHIEHWAQGGRTELSNLVQLCRRHHRLLHEGGYRLRRGTGSSLLFHRPDGRMVGARRRLQGDRRRLVTANRRAGVAVRADTAIPTWYGDRLDLEYTVDCLISGDSRFGEPWASVTSEAAPCPASTTPDFEPAAERDGLRCRRARGTSD
ncbi:MAG: DUF222 domain-containing protein [Thermoleophilaceae bacterium]